MEEGILLSYLLFLPLFLSIVTGTSPWRAFLLTNNIHLFNVFQAYNLSKSRAFPSHLYWKFSSAILVTVLIGLDCDVKSNLGGASFNKDYYCSFSCRSCPFYYLSVVLTACFNKINPDHQQAPFLSLIPSSCSTCLRWATRDKLPESTTKQENEH